MTAGRTGGERSATQIFIRKNEEPVCCVPVQRHYLMARWEEEGAARGEGQARV